MAETRGAESRVAVIGTGAIGTAVVRRLRAGGHDAVVWNRTPDRAAESVAAGAVLAGSIREAARSSSLILLTLNDHAAVRECIDGIAADLSGRTVIAMCTGTARDARLAAERVTRAGGQYLDAGVQASPEMIGTDAATFLYSGSRAAFGRHRATLGLLGTPRFAGETPEAAAVWDLALFGLWYDAQVGQLRALDTVREAGIDVAEFSGTAATQLGHVVTAVPTTVSELLRGSYPPGPATLSEHLAVIRQLTELRAGRRLGDGGLSEVAARVEALVAAGREDEGLTATLADPP